MNLSIFLPLFGVVIFISTLKCQWHLVRRSEDPFSALFPGQRVSIWKMREKCGQPVVWLDGWMAGWVDGMGWNGMGWWSPDIITDRMAFLFFPHFFSPPSQCFMITRRRRKLADWWKWGNGAGKYQSCRKKCARHLFTSSYSGTLLSRGYSQSVVMTLEKGWHYNIEYCYRERYTSYKN